MTTVTKPYRGRRPTKRLDLTDMKEALADGKTWSALGVVIAGEGGKPHWEIVDGSADIHVEVELQPSRERLFPRLAAGMWIVPAIGEEVAIILPAGDVTFMPTIVCILANTIPSVQGPTPTRIVIARAEVVIHDGSGGASELALKSDVAAAVSTFNNHTHTVTVTGTSTTQSGVTASPGSSMADPTGTTVLKAK